MYHSCRKTNGYAVAKHQKTNKVIGGKESEKLTTKIT